MMLKSLFAAAALAVTAVTADVPTVSAKGAKFFFSNGTQYFIKGMMQFLWSLELCG